jgi:TRAP-type uncharacterized transport system substrate-binding protein
MSKFNRRQFIGAAGAGAAFAIAPGMPVFAQAKRITIGTNPAGSIYYSLGGGLANHQYQEQPAVEVKESHVNRPLEILAQLDTGCGCFHGVYFTLTQPIS